MSAITEALRKAIYNKLNVSAVTSLATNGVHYMVAPDGADAPFVVFSHVPAELGYALGDNLVFERDLWLIKVLTDEDSSDTKSPVTLAQEILTACEDAIDGGLTATGVEVKMARRVRVMPTFMETVGDRHIYHHGYYMETFAI